MYTVFKKLCKIIFFQNVVKFSQTVKIFGIKMTNRLKLCEVLSFSTSPNSHQRTTVLNAGYNLRLPIHLPSRRLRLLNLCSIFAHPMKNGARAADGIRI